MSLLEIRNRTPYEVAIFPGLDKEGYDTATVLVKGTFLLNRRDQELAIAEEQAPILHADAFRGSPESASIQYASDVSPVKAATDVLFEGHVHPPRGVESIDVSLSVGKFRKSVLVFGNRFWVRSGQNWEMSAPAQLRRTPLIYENAFGGADLFDPDPAAHAWEERNPVGTGFSTGKRAAQLEGLRLPNIEDPQLLIKSPTDRPRPAGFGPVGRSWMPRRALGGTYDDRWKAERFPLLPQDFDDRFHQAAPADQMLPQHLVGGEVVSMTNVSELGVVRFSVPRRRVAVEASLKGRRKDLAPVMDTLFIEPDAQRVVLSWRTTFRCPRSFLYIEYVKVSEAKPS
jgi:hypothetical protein